MPGMAANPSIFRNIKLPPELFQQHLLEWFIPAPTMTLEAYARTLCSQISHKNPVLIGVSFGGFVVQEMARHMKVRKLIIISSVKLQSELPRRLVFARYTRIHKLLPTGLVNKMELLRRFAFLETVVRRIELYEEYLSIRDKGYLDWCINQMVNWNKLECPPDLIHIQGEKDAVFPIKYIKNCIRVPEGTHTMIIHRAKWFNERLPAIILEDRSSI